MSLNVKWSTILTSLKAEVGNENTSLTNSDASYLVLINNAQQRLMDSYDWPHLAIRSSLSVSGQYTNKPSTINFNRPVKVCTYRDNVFEEIEYGIDDSDLSGVDSVASETEDYIQRWQWYTATTPADQVEVWPIPATAQTLYFFGQKIHSAMDSGDTTGCMIDDLLLVYTVAAELLTRWKSPSAPMVVAKATERMVQLRRNEPVRTGFRVMGGFFDEYVKERKIYIS